jgi:hypothetical protein
MKNPVNNIIFVKKIIEYSASENPKWKVSTYLRTFVGVNNIWQEVVMFYINHILYDSYDHFMRFRTVLKEIDSEKFFDTIFQKNDEWFDEYWNSTLDSSGSTIWERAVSQIRKKLENKKYSKTFVYKKIANIYTLMHIHYI